MSETKATQVEQIKKAIQKVVTTGPDFLSKKISADDMAHTMVDAVEEFVKNNQTKDGIRPENEEAQELLSVLQELMGCGSGYLHQRCDAACVARTIHYMVGEFGEK